MSLIEDKHRNSVKVSEGGVFLKDTFTLNKLTKDQCFIVEATSLKNWGKQVWTRVYFITLSDTHTTGVRQLAPFPHLCVFENKYLHNLKNKSQNKRHPKHKQIYYLSCLVFNMKHFYCMVCLLACSPGVWGGLAITEIKNRNTLGLVVFINYSQIMALSL